METIRISETQEVNVRLFVKTTTGTGIPVDVEVSSMNKFEHDTIKSTIKWLKESKGIVLSEQRTEMLHWEVV